MDVRHPEYINVIIVDTSSIILVKNGEFITLNNYKDYIMLELDNFIPPGITLIVYPSKDKRCDSGCSPYFRPRKSCPHSSILHKNLIRFSRKDRRTLNNISKTMNLLVKISKIDSKKKICRFIFGRLL